MQKLIMPFGDKQMLLCGYKHPGYNKIWGYNHYGIDITAHYAKGSTNIIASGAGEIIAFGYDNSGGNIVVVKYYDVLNNKTGKSADIIARYFHLSKINVTKGQNVKVGDILGVEGNSKTSDYHLHLEFDSDTKYPCYSPQVAALDDMKTVAQGNILKHGIDTTINPVYLLHIKDGQTIVPTSYANARLVSDEDKAYQKLENLLDYKAMYEAEKAKYNDLVSKIKELVR